MEEELALPHVMVELAAAAGLVLARLRRRAGEKRSPWQILHHYRTERALARRLREAPRAERPRLYCEVYDELFRAVPDHPALAVRSRKDAARQRRRSVEGQWRFVRRFVAPGATFMEIGAGDCALSLRAAKHAGQVLALEVSAEATRAVKAPRNLAVLITGGAIPVADASVDVAFSNQLVEHLHPEDAAEQAREVCRSLVPGGVYVCVTPNRLYGPRDISAYFDDVATGLHLREYSAGEMRALLLESGFASVRFYAGGAGLFVRVPFFAVRAVEALLDALPGKARRWIADTAPLRALLGVRAAATKGK